MAPRNEMKAASKNNSWKRIKKEEKKLKRLKAELANVKSEIAKKLGDLEKLHLTITQIRQVIRRLLPPDSLESQLTEVLLAGINGD